MKRLLAIAVLAAMLSAAGGWAAAAPTTLHYWNFNSGFTGGAWPAAVPASYDAPGAGAGLLNHNFTETDDFAGSTMLLEPGDTAGTSFTGVNSANNGAATVFSAPTSGWDGVSVEWAATGSSTGFTTMALDYSLDGTHFTALDTTTLTVASYAAAAKDLGAVTGAANNADLKIRLTWAGATTALGTARLDNFKVTGAAPFVPTPVEISDFKIE